MSQQEAVIANLAFDRAFLDRVKAVENARRKTLHTNGVPSHYIFVFKTICVLKDNDMSIENISNKYREIFGRNINASSLSRTLLYLSDNPNGGMLKLITYTDNPFTDDSRFKGVALTGWGLKMQEIFTGKVVHSNHEQTKDKIRSVL